MSAAVNDRPHDVLSSRAHLPLTGEFHPLRREFERLLATGNVVALTFAMLACTIVYFWPREADIGTTIVDFVDTPGVFPSPPPIDPNRGGGEGIEIPAVVPETPDAVIEPVDELDPNAADPVEESGGFGEPGPGGPIIDLPASGGGPPLVVPPKSPSPHDFIPFDDEPALISWEPPVYPAMVREAGIDGTVNVRVLIGINGKVKDAYVVDGPPALRESALASARIAVFKPALQGVHPVEAWVIMPITFKLHESH